MKKIFVLMVMLICGGYHTNAQRIELVPYPDAVSYNQSGLGNLYLSNTDARTLMEYFANENMPDKIIPVKEGYYSGYRLCYTMGKDDPYSESKDWIQILTIDTDAALDYMARNTPEALELPFEGLKACVGHGYTQEDYNQVVNCYRHISCRIYRQLSTFYEGEGDEMTALLQSYRSHNDAFSGEMYAVSGKGGGSLGSGKSAVNDPWKEWINCFKEIESRGYITLIEINEPSAIPFME